MKTFKQFEATTVGEGVEFKIHLNLIKIDSRNRTVNLMRIQDFNYQMINELIGHGCRSYEMPVMLENRDALFTDEDFLVREFDLEVDENGMYDPSDFGFVFMPFSDRRPLYGNGLIIGSDEEGDSDSVKTPLQTIRQKVFFIEKGNDGLRDAKIWQWDGHIYKRTR
jgi:hypothetical protein